MVSPVNDHRVIVQTGVEVNENQADDVCVAVTAGDWFDDDNYDALSANACLIAAAPDLLDALCRLANKRHIHQKSYTTENPDACNLCGKDLRDEVHYRAGEDERTDLDMARAAIAKATGAK
jgi:hypothetical protein